VSGSENNIVQVALIDKSKRVFKGHSDRVNSVAFSKPSSGNHVVSRSFDKTVRVWNVATGELECVFKDHSDSVDSANFSSDINFVVSGSLGGIVRIRDVVGKSVGILKGHLSPVPSVVFSSDDSLIVSGSLDETDRVWDAVTCDSVGVFKGHSGQVHSEFGVRRHAQWRVFSTVIRFL
jgi:WD40 repeat protein